MAFVTMVSNHRYVDGALVVGYTLRNKSLLVPGGKADIVGIVNQKLKDDVLSMYLAVGYDYVKVMSTMAVLSPKSYYTYTFDKIYLWYMLQYDKVVFMDADVLCLKNPDIAFDTNVSGKYAVAAVGDHHSDYFQTAFLVLRPDIRVFDELVEEYKYGAFNYNQWRARDGILLRNCFKGQHMSVRHEPDGDYLYYYYGDFKPWFNKDKPPKTREKVLPIDTMYRMWWDVYELMHYTRLSALRFQGIYGGGAARGRPFGPERHMWLQRHSSFEYIRKTQRAWNVESNLTVPTLSIHLGSQGLSCDAVCRDHAKECRGDAFLLSSVQSCSASALHGINCDECSMDGFGDIFPTAAYQAVKDREGAPRVICTISNLYEKKYHPRCNSTRAGLRRLCPCVESAYLQTAFGKRI